MRSSKSNTKKFPPIDYPFRGGGHGGPAASTKLNFSREREKEREEEGDRKVSAAFAKETPSIAIRANSRNKWGKSGGHVQATTSTLINRLVKK